MWMAAPAGQCLRLRGGEDFTVTIPTAKLGDIAKTPLTMEMMLYLEGFASWGFGRNTDLFGLHVNYDANLGWRQGQWDRPAAPALIGPGMKAVSAEKSNKDFPRNRWCHVKITYDGNGGVKMYVDDKLFGEGSGAIFKRSGDTKFSLGPFNGRVDEVRVSTSVRE
jgi:hypothetical protein